MKSNTRNAAHLLGALGAYVLSSVGCGAVDPAAESTEATPDDTVDVGSTQQAVYSGWSSYTSEEYAPIVCDSGSLINAVQCSGSYCDNTRINCQPTTGTLGPSYWTSYFSEESPNSRTCASGYWVTGIACSGSYCDNVSIQCSRIYNVTGSNCYTTGWVSEEGGGTLSFGYHYYPQKVECSGSHCDNKRFYVCQI